MESNVIRWVLFYLKPKFGLIRTVIYEPNPAPFEGIYYIPDLKITYKDGSVEFWEIKGFLDGASVRKFEEVRKKYPSVKLMYIGTHEYWKIERLYSKLVRGWIYST